MVRKVTSKISGKEITEAQYITETVCSRHYYKKMGTKAKTGFWATDHFWTKQYKTQITKANSLLRMYDFNVIIKVLEKESWMYSLYNKSLSQKLLDEQKKQDVIKDNLKNKDIKVIKSDNYRSKQFSNKSKNLLNKLKDME